MIETRNSVCINIVGNAPGNNIIQIHMNIATFSSIVYGSTYLVLHCSLPLTKNNLMKNHQCIPHAEHLLLKEKHS